MKGLSATRQHTIQRPAFCYGIGLHSGQPVSLWLRPAAADSGITFVKHTPSGTLSVQARIEHVSQTRLATSLSQGELVVHTVEHLLAAVSGMGIDNLIIELTGSEVPIMDGSSQPFVTAIAEAGVIPQRAARSVCAITSPFEVREGDGWISAVPAPVLEIHNTVQYDHPAIGRQVFEYREDGPPSFASTLAGARTFGFAENVEQLKASGYIKGGSLDNAVVVGADGVVNPEGLRWPDEFVRHKTLDLLGDLALLGRPLRGRIAAHKAGHRLHAKFVAFLTAHPECWTVSQSAQTEVEEAEATAVLAGK